METEIDRRKAERETSCLPSQNVAAAHCAADAHTERILNVFFFPSQTETGGGSGGGHPSLRYLFAYSPSCLGVTR